MKVVEERRKETSRTTFKSKGLQAKKNLLSTCKISRKLDWIKPCIHCTQRNCILKRYSTSKSMPVDREKQGPEGSPGQS